MCLGAPGRILEVRDAEHHIAVVDVDGVRRDVSLGLLAGGDGPVPGPGCWVLVHLGFAMARIDEREAVLMREALQGPDSLPEGLR